MNTDSVDRRHLRVARRDILLAALVVSTATSSGHAAVIEINDPSESIQAAIDSAANGDVILIAPGTYQQTLIIENNFVTLASHYYSTGDPSYIDQTIIKGIGHTPDDPHVVRIKSSAPDGSRFIGLTFTNGNDGIRASAFFEFLNSRVHSCGDGLDYDGGSGGRVADSVVEDNFEDGIDIDGLVDVTIERSIVRNNYDEGIEIRVDDQPGYSGPMLHIVIRENWITSNLQDGVQIINGSALTPREISIERNVLADNAKSGIGMMCCNNTLEDFQGAAFDERVTVTNNTIANNDHGLTGGGNLVVLNNIFVGSTNVGLKNATGGAVVAHNLFYANGTNWVNSDVDLPTTLTADPVFEADFRLGAGSPAIDFGAAHFESGGDVLLDIQPGEYRGAAPDLGAFEHVTPVPSLPGAFLIVVAPILLATARVALRGSSGTRRSRESERP